MPLRQQIDGSAHANRSENQKQYEVKAHKNSCRFLVTCFRLNQLEMDAPQLLLAVGYRWLSTASPYQPTAIAVATKFAIARGSRNFHPNDIS